MIAASMMVIAALLSATAAAQVDESAPLPRIAVSEDGRDLVDADTGRRFVVWGVNYDHDEQHRLIEDYWIDEWETVVADFEEIKALGANVVRVHLQFAKFMDAPDQPNAKSLAQLGKLLKLAERLRLYLDITGLGCYRKADVPDWYDEMTEAQRWAAQASFWRAVAGACKDSDAVLFYDLMNEPIIGGNRKPGDRWLAGELGGFHFVQRITLEPGDRTRQEIARAWVKRLTEAIREVDDDALITVGVIPWVFVFGGGEPLFHHPDVGGPLDLVCVHFYPKTGEVDRAIKALRAYDIGKPLIIEEIFPLKAPLHDAAAFIEQSRPIDIRGAIMAQWLEWFKDHAPK